MENRRCTVVDVGELVDELGFCCEWCGKVYKSLVRYHKHIVCTHKLRVPDHQLVNCFHCPRSDCRYHKHGPGVQDFRQIGKLRRHYQEKHMTGHHSCESCQKQFQLKSSLVAHRCRLRHSAIRDSQSAINLGRHVCSVCEKGYTHLGALKRHLICSKHGTPNTPTEDQKDVRDKVCLQCNVDTHRCSVRTERSFKSDRLIFRKSRNLQAEDWRFLVEMEQLVRGIVDGTVRDPMLLTELASMLPALQRIQDSDLEIK
ncbi:gastrula zinc finger protein xFG20-1 [Drosophila sechellia]|uniref:GM22083 n=1 Tax=Drosophila sechellia TaxID=7238 RepID=B4IB35_DROSE|nr:gastrula zinc finger protein xFG20-1 [Drosophila sechellia]EDW44498.1 GM22083 [Drosophila sechellia]